MTWRLQFGMAMFRCCVSRGACRFVVIMFLMFRALPCSAQEQPPIRIADTIWGFDDRVVQGQFVPLSILLDNLSSEPLEGKLILNSVQGMLNAVGGDFEKDFFIGPTSRQWVQFYPYISDSAATWSLTLQTAEQEINFDPIPQSRRVFESHFNTSLNRTPERLPAVILDSAARISRIPGSIKHMPEEIFPPYGTATHSLYAMFLDHAPDWDVPRQEACMAWLRRGGRLHLLKDPNNQQIRFSGVMAPLNDPQVEFTVGYGQVTRHDHQRENLPEAVINRILTHRKGDIEAPQDEQAAVARQYRGAATPQSAAEFFEGLRSLSAPEHNWFILTVIALLYVGLLFPGSWLLSKKPNVPFYMTYLAIGSGAFLFSMIFLFFGRRGYGESTAINSLMIARHEDDDRWDVFGMSHIFVTDADEYAVEDNGHEGLLASGSESERVSGKFQSGTDAKFSSILPPFSGQPILSQRRIPIEDWQLRMADFSQNGDQLTKLKISVGKSFPSGDRVIYRVLHGRLVHTAIYNSAQRELVLGTKADNLEDFGARNRYDPNLAWGWARSVAVPADPETTPLDDPRLEFFRQAEPELLARSLLDEFANEFDRFELPPGEIRLLVYAPVPPELDLPFSKNADRDGRVLYIRPMRLEITDSVESGSPIP